MVRNRPRPKYALVSVGCSSFQVTYLKSLIQSNSSFSTIEAAFYGIRWAHNLYGFHNTCVSVLVKGVLESTKRSLSKPVVKKEPGTPGMILAICEKFVCVNANLSDLRAAGICITAYAGFLRFDKLAFLHCCDVKFCDGKYVELFIAKSKTDIYRNGNAAVLARTGNVNLPI